ncbi:hypothetical protein I3760_13G009300 [Carya illinoinensis]|nr:hypothetical protein I3760_13G009300 [Carya illinoinensis]
MVWTIEINQNREAGIRNRDEHLISKTAEARTYTFSEDSRPNKLVLV